VHSIEKDLPELIELERLIKSLEGIARVEKLCEVPYKHWVFPQYGISLGSQKKDVPVFGIFGGVHGLERIGSRVVLSFLQATAELAKWDKLFQHFLENSRIVFIPLINPVGTFLKSRSNGRGVDLMRNAPVDSEESNFMVGGHRLSKFLPWYRGPKNAEMETESKSLCDFVKREVYASPVAITLDVHSGYGTVDRLWFPYAKTKAPYPNISETYLLKKMLDQTYPNHVYVVEPQSKQYTTHGDIWDYLYDEHQKLHPQNVYLPLSLEMGSWVWVKKNPRQFFSILGIFNPVMNHRLKRTLRRHLILFDFLIRATHSNKLWAHVQEAQKSQAEKEAHALWYPTQKKAA
jgi:hypothetical protein